MSEDFIVYVSKELTDFEDRLALFSTPTIERDYGNVRRIRGAGRVNELVNVSEKKEALAIEREIADRKSKPILDFAR